MANANLTLLVIFFKKKDKKLGGVVEMGLVLGGVRNEYDPNILCGIFK